MKKIVCELCDGTEFVKEGDFLYARDAERNTLRKRQRA